MSVIILKLITASVFFNSLSGSILPVQGSSFLDHGLVPDVLNTPPEEVLNITFPNGIEVLEGNVLTINDVREEPTLKWSHNDDTFYTLIMADADPPSRENPEARSFLHWLVINIPGEDLTQGLVITDRINSNPEPGTGYHRYYFLVYGQGEYLEFGEQLSDFEERKYFSPEEFAIKNNLSSALAGNFYRTINIGKD